MNSAIAWRGQYMGETRGTYDVRNGHHPPQEGPATGDLFEEKRNVIPLKGGMFGLSNDLSEVLVDARMPGNHRAFVELVRRRSQGNAGFQRYEGREEPGEACTFDLAAWSARLKWDKSYTRRVRDRLVADHVLWFRADEQEPGRGRIGINFRFSEWKPLDSEYSKALHRRPGAGYPKGRPRQQQRPDVDTGINAANERGLPDIEEASVRGLPDLFSHIPVSTHASLESASSPASDDPLRKRERKDTKKRDADASPHETARTASSLSKRPRKMTDEQYAAHQLEQAWCAELLTAFRTIRTVTTLPNEGREKAAAKWYYSELLGVEDGVKKVLTCYKVTQLDPYRRTKASSLFGLQDYFPDYRKDPAGYTKDRRQVAAEYAQRTKARRPDAAADVGPSQTTTPDKTDPWATPRAPKQQTGASL